MPVFSVFDGSDRFLGWSQDPQQPGASVTKHLSPQPNATLVLHIWGYRKSTGKYRLTVRALKAFDRYEPNDDIQHPITWRWARPSKRASWMRRTPIFTRLSPPIAAL
jgi:hypothetical protein